MRTANSLLWLEEPERQWLEELVPLNYFLRQLLHAFDFEQLRDSLEQAYTGFGRPPLDAVFMLKLELLARHYRLSDRDVLNTLQFHIGFRLFCGISMKSELPDPSLLSYFRQRIGCQRLQQVFDQVVAQARQLGLVKDRLRLKDATHILANIAVPSTLQLVAQIRDRLLEALRPFAADRVAQEEQAAQAIRQATQDAKDEVRLLQRVTHLRCILAWADQVAADRQADSTQADSSLQRVLQLAHKVLADRQDPQASDKLLSLEDPDARRGKHGDFYDGYLLDVAMDADSGLLTALNVLPANGDEGADALELLRQEEQAHGNDVQALSMDGIGYRGDVLRDLTQAEGPQVEVFVPPTQRQPLPVFAPEDFRLSDDGQTLTCPAGESTRYWERSVRNTGRQFRFSKKQCSGCPLRESCLRDGSVQKRTVIKNDYEAEYKAAQAKAATAEYQAVRKEHAAIERKLSELVNRHQARRARYRGHARVHWQMLLTGVVVNLKRLVKLLGSRIAGTLQGPPLEVSVGMVRAELVGGV